MNHLNKWRGATIILYFVTLFTSLGLTLRYGIELIPDEIQKQLINVTKYMTIHNLELVLDITSSIMLILFIVLFMYNNFSKHPLLGLVSLSLIISGALVLIVHDMGNFAFGDLAILYSETSDPQETAVISRIAQSVLYTAKAGVAMGSALITIGFLALATFILAIGKKVLGIAGVLTGIIAIVAVVTPNDQLAYGLYMPFMIWQLVLGIYYLTRR